MIHTIEGTSTYQSEDEYTLYYGKSNLEIVVPEEMRYVTENRTQRFRDIQLDTYGIRAFTMPIHGISDKHREIIVELTKELMYDKFIKGHIGVGRNTGKTMSFKNEEHEENTFAILDHVFNLECSDLTKIAFVYSMSVTGRDYTRSIIDQILEVNGDVENDPNFNLSTISSYATPFYPRAIITKQGKDYKLSSIHSLIEYANKMAGVEDMKSFNNVSHILNDEEFTSMMYIFGKISKYNIDFRLPPSKFSLLDFYLPDNRKLIHTKKEDMSILHDHVYETDRSVHKYEKYKQSILTEEEINLFIEEDVVFNSTAVSHVYAITEDIEIARTVSKMIYPSGTNSRKIRYIFKEDITTISTLQKYINETNGELDIVIWLNLNDIDLNKIL